MKYIVKAIPDKIQKVFDGDLVSTQSGLTFKVKNWDDKTFIDIASESEFTCKLFKKVTFYLCSQENFRIGDSVEEIFSTIEGEWHYRNFIISTLYEENLNFGKKRLMIGDDHESVNSENCYKKVAEISSFAIEKGFVRSGSKVDDSQVTMEWTEKKSKHAEPGDLIQFGPFDFGEPVYVGELKEIKRIKAGEWNWEDILVLENCKYNNQNSLDKDVAELYGELNKRHLKPEAITEVKRTEAKVKPWLYASIACPQCGDFH